MDERKGSESKWGTGASASRGTDAGGSGGDSRIELPADQESMAAIPARRYGGLGARQRGEAFEPSQERQAAGAGLENHAAALPGAWRRSRSHRCARDAG